MQPFGSEVATGSQIPVYRTGGRRPYQEKIAVADWKRDLPLYIFLAAADRIGVPPQECIVIEDSINGIKAGHAAGMKVVHVPDTIQIDDTIRALTYCVCEHLGEVPDVIEKLNAQV